MGMSLPLFLKSFNSLQHFLPIGTNETRQAICDYLEQNDIETSVILEMDRPNYIAQMRKLMITRKERLRHRRLYFEKRW